MNQKSLGGFVQFSLSLFMSKRDKGEILRYPQYLHPVVPLAELIGMAEKSQIMVCFSYKSHFLILDRIVQFSRMSVNEKSPKAGE